MADEDKTDRNWRTRWAEGYAWALAHPKIARGGLLVLLLAIAFLAGRCSA